jgi:AraC-like DNA-binding protein
MATEPLAEIRTLITRHARVGEMRTPLEGLRVAIADAPTPPVSAVYEPVFALIAQGAKRTVLGETIFEYQSGQYLVASVELPIIGQVVRASRRQPYLSLGLTLHPPAIATLLLETAAAEPGGAEPAGLAVSDAPAELLDSVVRLLRLIDRPDDAAVLRPMVEREILWRLLTGEQGATVRQIGLADSRLSQVSRAIRWIRTRYAETLRTEDLAVVAGMSASTFYRHFRAVTSMSPLQFQKQIRLRHARARLIADARDVASVGFDVGYDSPSQFSREYSRLFGVPPGKDMKRLRSEVGLERSIA